MHDQNEHVWEETREQLERNDTNSPMTNYTHVLLLIAFITVFTQTWYVFNFPRLDSFWETQKRIKETLII